MSAPRRRLPARGARPPARRRGPREARRRDPLPYRVARWGKFWSLEPLFADTRSYLVAKGGAPPRLDELVLAVPVHGDRRRIVEVLGRADDLRSVLRAMLYAEGLPQGFSDDGAGGGGRGRRARRAPGPRPPRPHGAADLHHRSGHGPRLRRRHLGAARGAGLPRARAHRRRLVLRRRRRRHRAGGAPPHLERVPAAVRRADAAGGAEQRPLQPRAAAAAQVPHRRAQLLGRRAAHVGTVLPVADQQRPPADLRVRGRRSSAEGGGMPARAPLRSTGAARASAARRRDRGRRRSSRPGCASPHELAGLLRRRRQARGALTLGSFEPEYAFDRAGILAGAVARPETPSHALVEEFMLAANEAVAEFLLRKKARTLYRVHEPPEPASVRELLDQLEELGVPTPAVPGRRGRAGGAARRGLRPPQPDRRRDERPRGARRLRLVDAAAALAQAGALQPREPRALRAREPGLPALHLADPPLPGPRDAPQPAPAPRGGRRRAGRSRARRRRRGLLHARARDRAPGAARRRRRAELPARASACGTKGWEQELRRRGRRPRRRRSLRALRRASSRASSRRVAWAASASR